MCGAYSAVADLASLPLCARGRYASRPTDHQKGRYTNVRRGRPQREYSAKGSEIAEGVGYTGARVGKPFGAGASGEFAPVTYFGKPGAEQRPSPIVGSCRTTAPVRASRKNSAGARKIRELLRSALDGDLRIPAKSTIHAVLHRHALVRTVRRPRARATGTPLSRGTATNDLWCADFKGEFKLGNGRYCYPLTVTDHASRYLLLCEALESVREDCVPLQRKDDDADLPRCDLAPAPRHADGDR